MLPPPQRLRGAGGRRSDLAGSGFAPATSQFGRFVALGNGSWRLPRPAPRAMMALMLPAWATVVIALGGAAIGAAAGISGAKRTSDRAYQSAENSLTHETTEAWRALLIETCRALSDAWLEFRWLLYPPSRKSSFPHAKRCHIGIPRLLRMAGPIA